MKEVIVRLTSDRIKVKGGEYVREYQRGEWIDKNGNTHYCSICGFEETEWYTINYNFCPNCGARMKGADDD